MVRVSVRWRTQTDLAFYQAIGMVSDQFHNASCGAGFRDKLLNGDGGRLHVHSREAQAHQRRRRLYAGAFEQRDLGRTPAGPQWQG